MKKMIASALVAATAVVSTPAMAADVTLTLEESSPGVYTKTFGTNVTTPTFTDTYRFDVPGAGTVGATLVTLTFTGALAFTDVFLNGTELQKFTIAGETLARGTVTSLGGEQVLVVNGTLSSGGSGTYSGNVRFETAAVPEPATWALMILGFGVVGYSMRRRPSVRFSQAI